jgi:hypothetical protein
MADFAFWGSFCLQKHNLATAKNLILLLTVCIIVEDDFHHHFIHAVGDAVAILLANLGWGEIGGDDCEQLHIVALGQQIYNRTQHVAEVHDLNRLDAQVVNGKHIHLAQLLPRLIVGFHHPDDLFGVFDLNAVGAAVVLVAQIETA